MSKRRKETAVAAATEWFRTVLRERGQRWTREREAIVEVLASGSVHFTVGFELVGHRHELIGICPDRRAGWRSREDDVS